MLETEAYGFDKVRDEQMALGRQVRSLLLEEGWKPLCWPVPRSQRRWGLCCQLLEFRNRQVFIFIIARIHVSAPIHEMHTTTWQCQGPLTAS